MRGFARRQLPKADRGALTALYAGVELRLANVLPLNLQPILFADAATMGQRSFDLDVPGYWSPGFGIRWPSLIGVMRFTVAKGYLIRNNNPANESLAHWQFYWSLGEEF
jgi:translocation and assembly module TamA